MINGDVFSSDAEILRISGVGGIRIGPQAISSRLLQKRLELYLHLILAGIEELAEKCPIDNRKVILRHICKSQPSERNCESNSPTR